MESEKDDTQKISVEAVNGENFKIAYIDGIYSSLDPVKGQILFFQDVFENQIDEKGQLRPKKVIRKFIIDLRMSPGTFKGITGYLTQTVKDYDETYEEQIKKAKK